MRFRRKSADDAQPETPGAGAGGESAEDTGSTRPAGPHDVTAPVPPPWPSPSESR